MKNILLFLVSFAVFSMEHDEENSTQIPGGGGRMGFAEEGEGHGEAQALIGEKPFVVELSLPSGEQLAINYTGDDADLENQLWGVVDAFRQNAQEKITPSIPFPDNDLFDQCPKCHKFVDYLFFPFSSSNFPYIAHVVAGAINVAGIIIPGTMWPNVASVGCNALGVVIRLITKIHEQKYHSGSKVLQPQRK